MTKVTEFEQIVLICEREKQTGDVVTLSKMLNCSTDKVRGRLSRNDKETCEALYEIILQRRQLIQKYRQRENNL